MADVATGWMPGDSWGSRLAQVRQVMGWNQTEAAFACGLSARNWKRWEDGAMPRDLTDSALKISGVTEVDYLWLLGVRRQGLEPRTR